VMRECPYCREGIEVDEIGQEGRIMKMERCVWCGLEWAVKNGEEIEVWSEDSEGVYNLIPGTCLIVM
jgi:hypothetical protein